MMSYFKKSLLTPLLMGLLAIPATVYAEARPPAKPECIAPAQPGGGFDLTCRIAVTSFQKTKLLDKPMRTIYMPGGIGAVAYNNVITSRPADPNIIVAFSGGSLLNLAQGKFGRYTSNDVRWVASVGSDYGTIVVKNDSPYQDLKSLMTALNADPSKVVFGAGGSVGSQDWMTAALTAKAAGVDYRKMRFVAFEGGGESAIALRGGHVQVLITGAAEARELVESGAPVKVLAVFSDNRLPGVFKDTPTAKEQGYDIVWSIIRGFYVGPKVSDEEYNWWVDAFKKLYQSEDFRTIQEQQGLFVFDKTGKELDEYVKAQVKRFTELADSFGLIKK